MAFQIETLAPGLRWFIQLRWMALIGLIILCVAGVLILGISLPLGVIIGCVLVTALSNVWVLRLGKKKREGEGKYFSDTVSCAGLLVLDTLALSVILFFLGGAQNPFTAFYLLHITIAAVLLPALWAWIGVGLCGICYGLLFLSPYVVMSESGISCCGSGNFHLQGMLLAMVLVGICIALFVSRLKSALGRRETELRQAQMRAIRNEKFASLATLAAGVAHELATPLSTIAVVSADMESLPESLSDQTAFREDAKLIRSEVERCRQILEKLSINTTDNIGENVQSLNVRDIPEKLQEFLSAANYRRLKVKEPVPDVWLSVPVSTLLQALAVLIKNACESDISGGDVELSFVVKDGKFSASVRDDGGGMAPEILERAGEPFFTTKEPGKGMGLGIFLVRMFTERMKGNLELVSHSKQDAGKTGTTATIYFPFEDRHEEENSGWKSNT